MGILTPEVVLAAPAQRHLCRASGNNVHADAYPDRTVEGASARPSPVRFRTMLAHVLSLDCHKHCAHSHKNDTKPVANRQSLTQKGNTKNGNQEKTELVNWCNLGDRPEL